MYTPIVQQPIRDGDQRIYKFDNGYGASVVRHEYSYGGNEGLYELAVIKFKDNDKHSNLWTITYDTPITDDVLGYLREDDVNTTLDQIAALKK